MNSFSYHQKPQKPKSSRLRTLWGILMLSVYAFGNMVLSQSALCLWGQVSGQHEVVVCGDQVILHHPNRDQLPHRLFTQILVAISHSNAAGDHLLSCAQSINADCERSFGFDTTSPSIDAEEHDQHHFFHHALHGSYGIASGLISDRMDSISNGAALAQWCTVKRMV